VPEIPRSPSSSPPPQAGGLLRTSAPPTLNRLLLRRASVCAFTLKVSHAPISVECLFSVTLLAGVGKGPLIKPGLSGVGKGPLIKKRGRD